MGVVYEARDTKLGRTVALKFLPPQWSHDEGAKQRFLREAQAASATNHRNICVIHDIEQTDDGQLFIVMARYEGETLKRTLERGPVPVAEAIEIAAGVAEGLAKAHGQGVVHRDIKPGNLIVTEDGVKILDFGLAKFADSLQLTQPGSTLGTVAYMSPEQARGEEADERSDVWALGVVLYEMLTGEVPFKGTYPEAIFYAIKNEEAAPVSARVPDMAPEVERVVMRALTKDSAARYQTARDFARELRFLQGRSLPLDLRTEPLNVQRAAAAGQPVRKRRVTWARLAGAAVILAAAGGAYAWLARPLPRMPIAVAPVANHTGDLGLDRYRLTMTEVLISELEASPNLHATPYVRLTEMIDRFLSGDGDIAGRDAIQAISDQSGARFVVVPALAHRDGAWLAQADIRRADTGTTLETIETEAVPSSLSHDTAYRLMSVLASRIQEHFKVTWPHALPPPRPPGSRFRNLDAVHSFQEGLRAYDQMEFGAALSHFRDAAKEDPQRAIAQAWLSRVFLLLRQVSEAEAAARRAQELITRDTPGTEALFTEAVLAESRGDLAAAERRYRELGNFTRDDAVLRIELADFLKRQYRDTEAVDAYHEVLAVDSGYVRPHLDLCQLYTRLGEYPLAEQHAQTALTSYRATGSKAGEGQILLCLGELARVQGGTHLEDAARHIAAARVIFEKIGGSYNLARVYQYWGSVAVTRRNYREAAQVFEQGTARARDAGNRQLEGLLLMNLGVAHFQLGQRKQALDDYGRAAAVYEQIGEGRRAAEAEVNIAGLLVDYGGDQKDVLRRTSNARGALKKLGHINFELLAMQVEARNYLHQGRHAEAQPEMREALNIARERKAADRVVSLTADIALSEFLVNEYETARAALESLLATEGARKDIGARVTLGRIYGRLGDFKTASTYLQQAMTDIGSADDVEFLPLVHLSLGELGYESGQLPVARFQFSQAAAYWTKELPDASSVEARCYEGLLDSLAGKDPSRPLMEARVQQARAIGHVALYSRCLIFLARIDIKAGRSAEALAMLADAPPAKDVTIGPELEAERHYVRSQALAAHGEKKGAESEAAEARRLIEAVRASVAEPYRSGYSSRADIRPLFK